MDERRYSELLGSARPAVIGTPEEHERLLTIAEDLMDKGETLAPEERKLLELLVLLIGVFENEIQAEEDEEAPADAELPHPHETLQRLMEARHWKADVLLDVFGNPQVTGEVMAGRRRISKGQAKSLGKLFQVPARLFLDQARV